MPKGYVKVVTGPMFSGKTTELIKEYNKARRKKMLPLVFKPALDTRSKVDSIESHDGKMVTAIEIETLYPLEILKACLAVNGCTVAIIDEAQFFYNSIVTTVHRLSEHGITVVIGGLKADFRNEPFGPMPMLLAIADDIKVLKAKCAISGLPATRTQRLIDGNPTSYVAETVLVGNQYQARNINYHEVPDSPWMKNASGN